MSSVSRIPVNMVKHVTHWHRPVSSVRVKSRLSALCANDVSTAFDLFERWTFDAFFSVSQLILVLRARVLRSRDVLWIANEWRAAYAAHRTVNVVREPIYASRSFLCPPPHRFPSSDACPFICSFCLLVQETFAFQILAWMVVSVNRKACSVSPANVVPDFKDWPVRFVSVVSMQRRHAALVARLFHSLFRFIRWCLLAEPVSKRWIMCFRWTKRIISMLLPSGIHRPHLRSG